MNSRTINTFLSAHATENTQDNNNRCVFSLGEINVLIRKATSYPHAVYINSFNQN